MKESLYNANQTYYMKGKKYKTKDKDTIYWHIKNLDNTIIRYFS